MRSLAWAAYDERHLPCGELEPVRLAVLADALEEVGCALRVAGTSPLPWPARSRLFRGRSLPRPELSKRPGFRWSGS